MYYSRICHEFCVPVCTSFALFLAQHQGSTSGELHSSSGDGRESKGKDWSTHSH